VARGTQGTQRVQSTRSVVLSRPFGVLHRVPYPYACTTHSYPCLYCSSAHISVAPAARLGTDCRLFSSTCSGLHSARRGSDFATPTMRHAACNAP
jgi:hypothetical protein